MPETQGLHQPHHLRKMMQLDSLQTEQGPQVLSPIPSCSLGLPADAADSAFQCWGMAMLDGDSPTGAVQEGLAVWGHLSWVSAPALCLIISFSDQFLALTAPREHRICCASSLQRPKARYPVSIITGFKEGTRDPAVCNYGITFSLGNVPPCSQWLAPALWRWFYSPGVSCPL